MHTLKPFLALIAPVSSGEPVPPQPTDPVDPNYGIDEDTGYVRPSHPIVLPGDPGHEGSKPPVDPGYGIDLGLGFIRPSHPITLPGDPGHEGSQPPVDPNYGIELPQPTPPNPNWKITTAWTPVTGWIVVAVPTGPVATPSKRKH